MLLITLGQLETDLIGKHYNRIKKTWPQPLPKLQLYSRNCLVCNRRGREPGLISNCQSEPICPRDVKIDLIYRKTIPW